MVALYIVRVSISLRSCYNPVTFAMLHILPIESVVALSISFEIAISQWPFVSQWFLAAAVVVIGGSVSILKYHGRYI